MSKAIVDGIIRSSLNRREKRFDSLARKYSARSNPHLHTISYEDIRKTIVANFSIAMKKVTAENYEENPKVQQFLEKVARKTFNTYASKYMLGKGDTIQQYTDYIKIYQPKLNDKALKAPIFSTAIPQQDEEKVTLPKLYECQGCNRVFDSRNALFRHLRGEDETAIDCPLASGSMAAAEEELLMVTVVRYGYLSGDQKGEDTSDHRDDADDVHGSG